MMRKEDSFNGKNPESITYQGSGLLLLGLLALILIAFFVYSPLIHYPFMNWDDPNTVVNNKNIQEINADFFAWSFSSTFTGNWQPITWLSLALDYSIAGMNPGVFHVSNLVIHLANCILVFFAVRMIFMLGLGLNGKMLFWSSYISSTIFALHPLQVETVAWVTERNNLLFTMFYLMGVLFYLARRRDEIDFRYYACLVFFILSIASKPLAVTFPVVLVLLDYWPLKRADLKNFRWLIEKIPFFMIALLVSGLTIVAQKETGALEMTVSHSRLVPILNAGHSVVFYLGKFLCPLDLSPLYPFPQSVDDRFLMKLLVGAILTLFISAVMVFKLRGHSPVATSWLYVVIMLLPVLGFLQAGAQMSADRYMYLASLGFILPISFGLTRLVMRRGVSPIWVFLLIVGVLSFGTSVQLRIWSSPILFWERVVQLYPKQSRIAYENLAASYGVNGRLNDALRAYDEAIVLNPPSAVPHNGRATVLFDLGRQDEAIAEFKVAIKMDPTYSSPMRNLAITYKRLGRDAEAQETMKQAIEIERINGK